MDKSKRAGRKSGARNQSVQKIEQANVIMDGDQYIE